MTVVVAASENLFVFGQTVTAIFGYEAFGVDEPEFVAGFAFREAAPCVVLHYLFGDADACGAGAHEDQTLVFNGDAGEVDCVDVSGRCVSGKTGDGLGDDLPC